MDALQVSVLTPSVSVVLSMVIGSGNFPVATLMSYQGPAAENQG
jgi:hypothetical protein